MKVLFKVILLSKTIFTNVKKTMCCTVIHHSLNIYIALAITLNLLKTCTSFKLLNRISINLLTFVQNIINIPYDNINN